MLLGHLQYLLDDGELVLSLIRSVLLGCVNTETVFHSFHILVFLLLTVSDISKVNSILTAHPCIAQKYPDMREIWIRESDT